MAARRPFRGDERSGWDIHTSGQDQTTFNMYLTICSVQPNPRRQLNLEVVDDDQSSALVMI